MEVQILTTRLAGPAREVTKMETVAVGVFSATREAMETAIAKTGLLRIPKKVASVALDITGFGGSLNREYFQWSLVVGSIHSSCSASLHYKRRRSPPFCPRQVFEDS